MRWYEKVLQICIVDLYLVDEIVDELKESNIIENERSSHNLDIMSSCVNFLLILY